MSTTLEENVTTDNLSIKLSTSVSQPQAPPTQEASPENAFEVTDDSEETCYNMNSSPRGLFVLINQRDFGAESPFYRTSRTGTDEDARELEELFKELGFEVEKHENQTKAGMRKIFLDVQKRKNLNSFACAILSHGEEGKVFCHDGEDPLEIKILADDVSKNPNLVGKPKFWIIQACRGDEAEEPIAAGADADSDGSQDRKLTLPLHADFLFAYSSAPGFAVFRNKQGSWFIQELVNVFRQQAHKVDVVRMLTRVNHRVASKRSRANIKALHNKCQIPSITSQLRKDFYLMPSKPLSQKQ